MDWWELSLAVVLGASVLGAAVGVALEWWARRRG